MIPRKLHAPEVDVVTKMQWNAIMSNIFGSKFDFGKTQRLSIEFHQSHQCHYLHYNSNNENIPIVLLEP